MLPQEPSRGRSTYSPSLACHQRFRPFWVDARSGCRFSASDRQSIRERNKARSERGVVVDRYPKWIGHGESFSATKIAKPRLAAALLAQHEARPRVAPNPDRLRELRRAFILGEAVESLLTGLEGSALARHCARHEELGPILREMIALAEA